MGDNFVKFLIYTVVLVLIVYLVTNPDVLGDYSDRMYVATISEPYRATAQNMFKLNSKVRKVETDYDRHRVSKATARQRLLDYYDQYERIVYALSQSSVNPSDRDELIAKIRSMQNAINRWGGEQGF